MIYCVVPGDLADLLYEPLHEFFSADPSVGVVVEFRGRDRRRPERRRTDEPSADERRTVRNAAGRRVADRRAIPLAVEVPALPPVARPHADRLAFVERAEPTSQKAEDADSAQLVIRAQQGDESAFPALYTRYFDRIYSYARLMLKDQHEAEDVAQEVFIQMFRVLRKYEVRADQPFRVLLFRIGRNRCIDHLRKHKNCEVMESDDLEGRRAPTPVEDPGGAFDRLSDGELGVYLRRLPATQRQVVVLRYLLDLSTEEVATVVDATPAAVRNLQYRGLEFLRAVVT